MTAMLKSWQVEPAVSPLVFPNSQIFVLAISSAIMVAVGDPGFAHAAQSAL